MPRAFFWILIAAGLFGAGALTSRALRHEAEEHDHPAAAEHESASKPEHNPDDASTVSLDDAAQHRLGLETQPLVAATLQPRIVAYGMLESDPASSFALRAPIVGTLRAPEDGQWPALGDRLAQGQLIGQIQPRLTAVEQADLFSRLANARAEIEEIHADLEAVRASYESKRKLNEEGRIVSDRTAQEALARVKTDEARLKAANETAKLIESALSAKSGPAGPISLTLPRGGEVVEISAQPGEVIESGQPILRVSNFVNLLARVTIPAGEALVNAPKTASIAILAKPDNPIVAESLAARPAIDPTTQGLVLLFKLKSREQTLRPGMAVQAFIERPGPAITGVILPRTAVIRHAGAPSVFVEVEKGKFARRPVSLDHLVEAGWLSRNAPDPGARVVVVGAAALLGEEMKSQFQSSHEGEEE